MCLSLGCGINPPGQRPSRINELDIDIEYNAFQNDDRISVFDVTVPGKSRYAMMQLSKYKDYGPDSDDEIAEIDTASGVFDANTVLNSSKYLLRYTRDSSGDLAINQAKMLDDLPQVDVAALASAWPHGDFQICQNARDSNSTAKVTSPRKSVESLTAASMRTLIERTMQGDVFDADLLAEADQVQGFRDSLCAHLHAHPEIVQGKSSVALPGYVNRNSAAVDLSPFWLLPFEDVLAVTDTIAGGKEGFKLFLPNLEDLTASNLEADSCQTA